MSSSPNIESDRRSPGVGSTSKGGRRRSSGGMYVPSRHDELASASGSGAPSGSSGDGDPWGRDHADDDESTPGPADNPNEASTRRPLDTALRQQRMRSWQPILDPTYVVAALFVLGVVFLSTGLVVDRNSRDLVEEKVKYDSYHDSSTVCYNITANENRTCLLSFTAPRDMSPPVLIHYEIENFYQNHRRYVKSRDDVQLRGDPGGHQLGQDPCAPLRQLGNQTLNPCGLIANTLFNDVIILRGGNDATGRPLNMSEKGIAWESDLQYKFKQVDGFRYEQCSSCTDCTCDGVEWTCNTTDNTPYEVDGGYCESLRAELAPEGVKVCVISPGYIRTNLSRSAVGSKYGRMDPTTAGGADPFDVARTVLDSVSSGRSDVIVAAGLSARVATWLRFLFPSVLERLLVSRYEKSRREGQREEEEE